MASKSSALGALLYGTESNFGETTTTTSVRLRPLGAVTYDLKYEGMKQEILRQRPNEGVPYVRGPMGGSISFTMHLTGLGATCAGAAPASALATLLGYAVGVTATGLATGDTMAGAGTASAPTTTGASGTTAGALVHIGAKGDTRADGQWVAVSSHSASTLNLLTAVPSTPNNGDVLYSSRMVYPSQTTGTYETITGLRFRFLSAQQQYLCHGCYPTAIEFNIEVGAVPTVKLTYAVSWWELVNGTFPDTTSVQDYAAAPVAGGSMFINAVGTATRNTIVARSVSMSVAFNNQGEPGVGGYNEHQLVVGANRGPGAVMVEMTIDSEAAGTDTYGDLFDVSENSRINRHALYSMSVGDGRALGIYWPNLTQTEKPIQMDDGGVLRKKLRFEALTGTTTTTDLTLSPYRIGMA
jgi:hypothetical protein